MSTELYADILFLIDFSMDALTLYMTGRFTRTEMKTRRIAISAAFGGVVSVVITALSAGRLISLAVGVICSAVMTYIAFGRSKVPVFVTRVSVLWSGGMLLGGVMTAVSSFGVSVEHGEVKREKSTVMLVFLTGALIALLLFAILGRSKKIKETEVKLSNGERSVTVMGLVDSGNLLKDPFSGKPVIVLSKKTSTALFGDTAESLCHAFGDSEVPDEFKSRIRAIPVKTVSGESLLAGIGLDRISIGGKLCPAVVALSEDELSADCIVPAELL